MSKINLKIDGKSVQTESGNTLLAVAKECGVTIPTLCYSGHISKSTSCFVCIVKDNKTGRYLPSCSSIVSDGMDVDISSLDVVEMRQSALNLLLSEHSGDCEAPCTIACPAHATVEEYVKAGKEGEFLKALQIIKGRIPLPMSIGRVCPRFCEVDCRRNIEDKPVAINDFKRLAADLHYESYMEETKALNGKKVAVIGAGPAGFAAAYYLRLEGVASDIFEMMPKAGGMLRYGIPEYRLPKEILETEYKHLDKMGGITVSYNQKLGDNLDLDELKSKYDAVVVAIGSWKSSSARIEGEDLAEKGIAWLENIASADWSGKNPGKTIVIGGGNTAMDCLRTSIRLGGDVSCYYRRTEKEMPAEDIEILEAKEEGVKFELLTAPLGLREENGKKILKCVKMELGEPDASGRRRPFPIEGSEFEVEADTVIAAIGQKTDAPASLATNKWGDVHVRDNDYNMEGNVFAAGDCVSGPATVVEAVAGGRRAALGALALFNGEVYEESYTINVSRGHWQHLKKDDLVLVGAPASYERREQHLIPVEERTTTFKEVSKTFTEQEIIEEGERCYECSCTDKHSCGLKEHSEAVHADPEAIEGMKNELRFDTRHPLVILDGGKCIKCGICVKISNEVLNNAMVGFKERGFSTRIGTPAEAQIEASMEEFKMIIENCPTGALAWREKKANLR